MLLLEDSLKREREREYAVHNNIFLLWVLQNSFLFNLFILDNWIWLNDLRFEFLKNGLILILSRIIYLILITFLVIVLSALRILFQFSFFLGVYCCSLSITNLHYILRADIIILGFKLRHCSNLIRSLFLLIKIKIATWWLYLRKPWLKYTRKCVFIQYFF